MQAPWASIPSHVLTDVADWIAHSLDDLRKNGAIYIEWILTFPKYGRKKCVLKVTHTHGK